MRITENELRILVRKELDQKNLDEGALDWLQGGLDIVGLIPGVGEAADGLNAVISLGRGNPLEALLSAISMVPVGGDAVGKGGKIVLKLFNPAMDLIKNGAKHADIIKKIGPKNLKKAKAAVELVKDAAVKHSGEIKSAVQSVKKADLDGLEKVLKVKVPDVARKKAQSALEKASKSMDTKAISNAIEFLSNLDLSGGEEKEQGSDQALAASYNPRGFFLAENKTLVGHVMGDEYINDQLAEMAEFVRKL